LTYFWPNYSAGRGLVLPVIQSECLVFCCVFLFFLGLSNTSVFSANDMTSTMVTGCIVDVLWCNFLPLYLADIKIQHTVICLTWYKCYISNLKMKLNLWRLYSYSIIVFSESSYCTISFWVGVDYWQTSWCYWDFWVFFHI
jgi:hypothetical protein